MIQDPGPSYNLRGNIEALPSIIHGVKKLISIGLTLELSSICILFQAQSYSFSPSNGSWLGVEA